jgi:hypothetical protein
MNDDVEGQKHRLAKKAGSCAHAETFIKMNGSVGYNIRCRVCHHNGVNWNTKKAFKGLVRKHTGQTMGTWDLALTLWVLHMQIHHQDRPQPDWHLPKDVDPIFEKAERAFNASGEESAEEKLLRSIFGDK